MSQLKVWAGLVPSGGLGERPFRPPAVLGSCTPRRKLGLRGHAAAFPTSLCLSSPPLCARLCVPIPVFLGHQHWIRAQPILIVT